jgi:glycosyltransferase involved in cell wall biosynthesis
MKILLVGRSQLTSYGGVQTFIRSLLTFLATRGIDANYLQVPRYHDGEAYFLYSARHGEHRAVQISDECPISDIVKRLAPNLIHSHNLHTPFRLSASEVESLALSMGLPHVLTVHDVTNSHSSHSMLNALKATKVYTQSQFNRHIMTTLLRLPDVGWLPIGIPFDEWVPEAMPTKSAFACPGRLMPGKGAEVAVALLGVASELVGPISLCLSNRTTPCFGHNGDFISDLIGEARRYPDLSITFNSSNDSRDMYRTTVATLVLPTIIEGFNLVGLESLAMGRPVIASPTGGMLEWMTGQAGVVMFSGEIDPCSFAQTIKQMLNDKEQWYANALLSRADLSRHYDLEVAGNAHCRLYHSLI